eukprot:sb/3462713/
MDNLIDSVKRGVREYARSSRTSDGRSTLHLAVLTNACSPITTLLDAGVDRSAQDQVGNTAIHVAATEGADTSLKTLLTYQPPTLSPGASPMPGIKDLVDMRNNKGETALHLACRANSLSCIKLLLENSSDMYNMTPEGKQPVHYAVKYDSVESAIQLLNLDSGLAHTDSNNEPLIHLATSKEMVELLVKYGVDSTARDSTGVTALHSAIKQRSYKLLIALILAKCPLDLTDSLGNTALHTCVYEGVHPSYVKTLVVFGAPLEVRNNSGRTAYELSEDLYRGQLKTILQSVGAHDPVFMSRGADRETRAGQSSSTHPRFRPSWGERDAAVLSVDGGGIKGLVATQILLELEKVTNSPVVDLFDWISGSSIGSLLVLANRHAQSDIKEMQLKLFDLKNKVFEGTRPYKSETLEETIKDILGSETKMLDSLYPRVIVTTVIADVRPCVLHLFTNYGETNEHSWKAARASGAAPSYFSPFKNKYLDGGVMANNPTLTTLCEMKKYSDRLPDDVAEPCRPRIVVSVGTSAVKKVAVENIDVGFRPRNPVEAAKFASGVMDLLNTLVEQCTNCDGPAVEQAACWCDSVGAKYFRLQPDIADPTPMDEKNDTTIIEMCWQTCQWIYREREKFEAIADELYSSSATSSSARVRLSTTTKVHFKRLDLRFLEIQDLPLVNTLISP